MKYLALSFISLVLIFAGFASASVRHRTGPVSAHRCKVPCFVELGNAEEDDWDIAYGWRDKRHAVLGVYLKHDIGTAVRYPKVRRHR